MITMRMRLEHLRIICNLAERPHHLVSCSPPNVQLPEFKPGMIQLLPTFHELENANPYVHIREFEEVAATFQNGADTIDTIKLRFFLFSLKDNANVWLYSLRPRSICS
ncbi:hypothetical protein Pint_31381 [Pistacia integerrima]|uniref:Uncharacterized protein n=1 Tax=Pistacia integerrima TaxID=434235 RepID=A0ACC0XSF2_9ROSI|nr:hypothetical protein Pint_31381 [Pistacia integerrima]